MVIFDGWVSAAFIANPMPARKYDSAFRARVTTKIRLGFSAPVPLQKSLPQGIEPWNDFLACNLTIYGFPYWRLGSGSEFLALGKHLGK